MPDLNIPQVLPVSADKALTPQQEGLRRSPSESQNEGPSFSSVLRGKQAGQTQQPSEHKGTPAKAAEAVQEPDTTPADPSRILALPPQMTELAQWLERVRLQGRPEALHDQQTRQGESHDAPLLALQTPATTDKPAVTAAMLAASAANSGGKAASSQADNDAGPALAVMPDARGKASLRPDDTSDRDPAAARPQGLVTTPQAQGAQAQDQNFAQALDAARDGGVPDPSLRTAAPQTNVPTEPAARNATQHTIHTPVGQRGWTEEVGNRLAWTARQDGGRAELVLTPANLGRIEVSIQLNGDQASASFVAANPLAREALQEAMPRLREMLAQSGVQLGQADVGAGQNGHAPAEGRGSARSRGDRGGDISNGLSGAGSLAEAASHSRLRSGHGLVDTFA